MRILFKSCVLSSLVTFIAVRLPLHSLRSQESTSHCWAYASSHMLESRALVRDSIDVVIDVERDVKYWVDYERMMAIYRLKHSVYLEQYEGGWQIEYWNAFLKHGKSIHQAKDGAPTITYPVLQDFTDHLPFMEAPQPKPDPTLISLSEVKEKLMHEIKTEDEARAFALDYLDRWRGKPNDKTSWMNEEVNVEAVPERVMGGDFAAVHSVDDLILISPVSDGDYKWVKFLDDRFLGYRYPKDKVLALIQTSLDANWPVTFDNVGHAMTIIGFHSGKDHLVSVFQALAQFTSRFRIRAGDRAPSSAEAGSVECSPAQL
jgi:hypothetical protein